MPATYGARRPHRSFWILLSLIALFGMLQASATMDWSLRTDEPFTANATHATWSGMWAMFEHDNIAPLHYVLLWGWVRVFGESEIALRIPSLLSFGAMMMVVGRTAQRAARSRAGLMAALLLAISTNMGQVHAASARPYAVLGLLIALATHVTFVVMPLFAAAQSIAAPQTLAAAPAHPVRWHILLIGLHTLGLLTHSLYAFVIAALTLAALWVSRQAFIKLMIDGAVAVLLFLLLDGPLLFRTITLPTLVWMPVPHLKDLVDGFLNLWGAQKTQAIGLYLLVLAGVGLWHSKKTWLALSQPVIRVGLTCLAFTSLAPFVISQIKPIYIETRAPVLFLPFACIVAAVIIRQLDHRLISLAVLGILATASAWSAYQLWRGDERLPVRASLEAVAAQVSCEDVLIFESLSLASAQYYFRQFETPACLQLETFPLDTAIHPGWLDGPGLLARPELLHREAQQTATRLAHIPGRVWLFYDSQFYPEIGDVIKFELDQQLELISTLALRGAFFDSVLIYSPSR